MHRILYEFSSIAPKCAMVDRILQRNHVIPDTEQLETSKTSAIFYNSLVKSGFCLEWDAGFDTEPMVDSDDDIEPYSSFSIELSPYEAQYSIARVTYTPHDDQWYTEFGNQHMASDSAVFRGMFPEGNVTESDALKIIERMVQFVCGPLN